MRTIILLLFALVSIASYGTSITVSNNPDHPAQYTSLQAAIDDATDGDTIYVQGSNTSYNNITINKKIVLIGAGPNPSTQLSLKSKLGDIGLYKGVGQDAAGTTIMGFLFNVISVAPGSGNMSDITIQRNSFSALGQSSQAGVLVSNWIIQHNIITGYLSAAPNTSSGWTNFIVRNNIFVNADVRFFTTTSILFDHNVFIGIGSGQYVISTQRSTFTNNIFYWTGTSGRLMAEATNYCVFNNNLANLPAVGSSYHTPTDDFVNTKTNGAGGNTGGGNLIEVSPDFTAVPSFVFADIFDFRLKEESVAKNAGTDGTDLGIFGGSNPWPDYFGSKSAPHPPIPQLLSVDIQNSTVPVNGTLTIKVKAKSQN